MLGKRFLCFVLIAGLILPGCASRRPPTDAASSAAPVPLPVDPEEAAPYDPRNAKAVRRPGALRILCEDLRFAGPAVLLPDLPQIRQYFADRYGLADATGAAEAGLSERLRELYAPYTRSAEADMKKTPPQINFAGLPAGSYIVFLAPRTEQPPWGATQQSEAAFGEAFMLRIRVVAAQTTTRALGEIDVPLSGEGDQRARRFIAKDAPLPSGVREEDAILLQSGERLLWPEGVVLRLLVPPLPPPPSEWEQLPAGARFFLTLADVFGSWAEMRAPERELSPAERDVLRMQRENQRWMRERQRNHARPQARPQPQRPTQHARPQPHQHRHTQHARPQAQQHQHKQHARPQAQSHQHKQHAKPQAQSQQQNKDSRKK